MSDQRTRISQHGITWTFDRPYPCGRFITGDWWVVGPVRVVSVSPEPGPVDEDPMQATANVWGDVVLEPDTRMRNGSMIVLEPGPAQPFDSRLTSTYDPDRGVDFPLTLPAGQSLVSTSSYELPGGTNLAEPIMWDEEKAVRCCLQSAAVLTCLAEPPPEDAFRPAYVGKDQPIHREADIRWERLADHEPEPGRPDWTELARYFARPWIDHGNWTVQSLGPAENNPIYGREFSRVTGLVALALNTRGSRADKRAALIGLVQNGIDVYGAIQAGHNWLADGGHYSGRKLPVRFAGLMLDDDAMLRSDPEVRFQEDMDTYYAETWFGAPVSYQMVTHHGPKRAYEHRHPDEWNAYDRRSEGYRVCCNGVAWVTSALAIRLMEGGIAAWSHDAFFDYCDRWMADPDPWAAGRGEMARPSREAGTFDDWVTAMWRRYRSRTDDHPLSGHSRRWYWTMDGDEAVEPGWWEDDPRPEGLPVPIAPQ